SDPVEEYTAIVPMYHPVQSSPMTAPPSGFTPVDFNASSAVKRFPFSATFQTKALAVILRYPSMTQDYINDVRAGYFSDTVHQNLFRLVQTYYQTYKCAPTELALMELIQYDCD